MRIGMIAPPGAGKGTQSALIAAHFNIPHICTGEILRDHVKRGTATGRVVSGYLDRGELVPDEVLCDTVHQALNDVIAAGGDFVLDGMPRTMDQARAIHRVSTELGMAADVVLHLKADDETVRQRMLARAAVEHRSDDTEPVIERRLALYHQMTEPILAWYAFRGILVTVDATRTAAEVGREILGVLEVLRPVIRNVPEKMRRPVDLTMLTPAMAQRG
ncbi:adenylate kinase [Dactylosporangium sp. NPDC049525]|uniref:adenylate kinase n=1 Tax=Dactylosporangium sp. NPDC049525 TaxID=3154730 RepID=UPI00341273D2